MATLYASKFCVSLWPFTCPLGPFYVLLCDPYVPLNALTTHYMPLKCSLHTPTDTYAPQTLPLHAPKQILIGLWSQA